MFGDGMRWYYQLLIAAIVVGCMAAGSAVAGMCGGLGVGLASFVIVQVFRVAIRPATRDYDDVEQPRD
jgi:hypothetical protein